MGETGQEGGGQLSSVPSCFPSVTPTGGSWVSPEGCWVPLPARLLSCVGCTGPSPPLV